MIIDNKEYELERFCKFENLQNNILKIKLKAINIVTDMSDMFDGCSSLISLPDISKWNTNNVECMSYMFSRCSSLISLPDISKWNIKYTNNMFDGCHNLIISKKIKRKFIYNF